MRDDMSKVIVERPPRGSRMRTREGRLYRAAEDVPGKIGMKQGYTNRKGLNENLSPLKRWLESQVTPSPDYGAPIVTALTAISPRRMNNGLCRQLSPQGGGKSALLHSFTASRGSGTTPRCR